MNRQISILADIVRHPVKAFKEITSNGNKFLTGALVIFVISTLLSVLLTHTEVSPGLRIFTIVMIFVNVGIIYCLSRLFKGKAKFIGLFSAILYIGVTGILATLLASGLWLSSGDALTTLELQAQVLNNTNITGNVASQLNTSGEDIQTQILEQMLATFSTLFTPLNVAILLLDFAVLIWGFILYIIAIREANNFTTWKALAVSILAMIVNWIISSIVNSIFKIY
jgi:hypothetical protein